MRVALYSGAIPSTTFIEALIRGLAARGIEIVLFGAISGAVDYGDLPVFVHAAPGSPLGQCGRGLCERLRAGLKPAEFPLSIRGSWPSALKQWARLGPMRRVPFDLFHCQWPRAAVELQPYLAGLHCPKVLSLRGTQINVTPWTNPAFSQQLHGVLPLFSAFHAVSEAMKAQALALGVPEARLAVIHPAVDVHRLLPAGRLRSPSPTLRIVSVGRDHWKKGYVHALDGLALARKVGLKDWSYEIIGPGAFEAEKFQARDLALGAVSFVGGLPHPQVLQRIGEADLLLLPSVEEGLANVVLEAMALGTPVLSSDCDGMPEAIVDGRNGLLFAAGNAESLAHGLMRFAAMAELDRRQMALAARQTIEDRFSVARQVDRFIELYARLLSP
jgi:colanic acid/amylovoran biosynthesis glycosyltransferase